MDAIKFDYLSDGRNIWVGIVVLAAGLCATLIMVWSYHETSQKISRQETLIASIKSSVNSRPKVLPVERDTEQTVLETSQAKAIILELNLPWKELFGAIESYQKDDVAVLAIEPDAQKGSVRINAEAKTLESMIAYLAYLQKIPLFRDVELVTHQVQEQDTQQPIRFMLQAAWGTRP